MRNFLAGTLVASAALFGLGAAALAQTAAAPPAATQPAPASSYTDAQLQDFAEASIAIDRIRGQAPNAPPTPESQAQMRAVLEQHHLNAGTYNALVASIQADPVLAQRVQALRAQAGGTATTTNQ